MVKLEQLVRLRSKITPLRPMITQTSDSHQIPSQNKTKSKLQILKNCQKSKFWNFASNFTRYTPSEVAWYDRVASGLGEKNSLTFFPWLSTQIPVAVTIYSMPSGDFS